MNWITGIHSTIRFVWSPSRAPKCAHCFGIRHVLLLPNLDLSSRCAIPSGSFGELKTSFKSLQRELLNEPRRKPLGALDVPLRVELPFFALSSSFRVLLGLFSPLRTRNTYPDSSNQSALIGAALKFPSALVALERTMFSSPPSAFCLVASLPELRSKRSTYSLKALDESFPTSPGATRQTHSLFRYVPDRGTAPSPACFASGLGSAQPLGR